MPRDSRWSADAPYLSTLILAAVVAVLPLILHGSSCGHDFDFHLQSWLDASAQLRHGTLDPAWTYSAAWNAGEPRFLFYPPLSWMLGALLTLALPIIVVPVIFTAICLAGAGLAMYRLARAYAPRPSALLASAIYLANPYMLFTAFERTAYGELLAATWMPLLLLAVLRARPRIPEIAIPLALLWLTNAPAAVIGVYVLIAIAIVRCGTLLWPRAPRSSPTTSHIHPAAGLLTRFAAGGALGLALPAFYLLPAAYERRYVQVAMAIIPNMRFQDNFLFGHTGDPPHDQVLHTASLLAIGLLVTTVAVLIFTWLSRRHQSAGSNHPFDPLTASPPLLLLILSTVAIAILLTPISTPVWQHLPELAFLQFPWRLLLLLGVFLSLSLAILLRSLSHTIFCSPATICVIAIALVSCLTAWSISRFRQPCEALDPPSARAQLFLTHHGVEPTDEYTPAEADNDVLRWDDPSYWLSSSSSAFAPGTIPNPAATILNYDVPPPTNQTLSGTAPHHLELHLTQPQTLILNLRNYPGWRITRNGGIILHSVERDDGLIAVPLPAGTSVIDIHWHRTWDQSAGDAISIAALLALAALAIRSRTIKA
jgi:hypothetical protein